MLCPLSWGRLVILLMATSNGRPLSLREPVLSIMVTRAWPSWFPQPLTSPWGRLCCPLFYTGWEPRLQNQKPFCPKTCRPGSEGAGSATSHRTGDLKVMVTVNVACEHDWIWNLPEDRPPAGTSVRSYLDWVSLWSGLGGIVLIKLVELRQLILKRAPAFPSLLPNHGCHGPAHCLMLLTSCPPTLLVL